MLPVSSSGLKIWVESFKTLWQSSAGGEGDGMDVAEKAPAEATFEPLLQIEMEMGTFLSK
jgi:hypothetical protein